MDSIRRVTKVEDEGFTVELRSGTTFLIPLVRQLDGWLWSHTDSQLQCGLWGAAVGLVTVAHLRNGNPEPTLRQLTRLRDEEVELLLDRLHASANELLHDEQHGTEPARVMLYRQEAEWLYRALNHLYGGQYAARLDGIESALQLADDTMLNEPRFDHPTIENPYVREYWGRILAITGHEIGWWRDRIGDVQDTTVGATPGATPWWELDLLAGDAALRLSALGHLLSNDPPAPDVCAQYREAAVQIVKDEPLADLELQLQRWLEVWWRFDARDRAYGVAYALAAAIRDELDEDRLVRLNLLIDEALDVARRGP